MLNQTPSQIDASALLTSADTPEDCMTLEPGKATAAALECALERTRSLLTMLISESDLSKEHAHNVLWTAQGQIEQARLIFAALKR